MKLCTTVLIAGMFLGGSGCALTSKADLVGTRYFTPETSKTRLGAATKRSSEGVLALRLGRVSSGAHLRERIAYRDAASEINYYEDQRWTERPEIYVRRVLARTLFEDRAFRRVLGGSAPTLDVEVIAFDELRSPTGRSARVELAVVLYEDRNVLFEETITVDQPIAGPSSGARIEDIVAAIGHALDAATQRIAVRVATEMDAHAMAAKPAR